MKFKIIKFVRSKMTLEVVPEVLVFEFYLINYFNFYQYYFLIKMYSN